MAVRGQDIASIIRRQIEDFGVSIETVDVGSVIQIGDGIATVHGLTGSALRRANRIRHRRYRHRTEP